MSRRSLRSGTRRARWTRSRSEKVCGALITFHASALARLAISPGWRSRTNPAISASERTTNCGTSPSSRSADAFFTTARSRLRREK
jgi:hypothetical protein